MWKRLSLGGGDRSLRGHTPGYQDDEKNPNFRHGRHWSRKRRLARLALVERGAPLDVCECCKKKIQVAKFVQFHHKNRNPWDNRPQNVEVLCVACHAREHYADRRRDVYGRLLGDKPLAPPCFTHRKRDAHGKFC